MAIQGITDIEFTLTQKYAADDLRKIFEALKRKCTLTSGQDAIEKIVFALLKQCSCVDQVSDTNKVSFREVNTEFDKKLDESVNNVRSYKRTITVGDVLASVKAINNTFKLRGYANALSLKFAELIQEDANELAETDKLVTDKSLHFPGGCLIKKLSERVVGEDEKYFLSDAIHKDLIPESVLEVIDDHIEGDDGRQNKKKKKNRKRN